MRIEQKAVPGGIIYYRGDAVTFHCRVTPPIPGNAFLRTNLNHAAFIREEEIVFTETGRPRPDRSWRDLPMKPGDTPGEYELTLPLCETGFFEGKCCFMPSGGERLLWPEGDNLILKVEPEFTAGGNLIYNAFVRQFGPHPSARENVEAGKLEEAGFHTVPPSGHFRDVIKKLDLIFDWLDSSILQLLPVHPAPVLYGKMGDYGSPFAATDYFAVDSAYAEFDRAATPMEQFVELIDAVHSRGGRIFLDLPVNHTGWASKVQQSHPEYFVRGEDGVFESPGAWGVVWEDLCKLDYSKKEVMFFMAEVFLFWCRKGVDGFRCDAGYMVPERAWRYISSKVRREFPDTIFLLEGLGGDPMVQNRLLRQGKLNWAYSELFQNYSKEEITSYWSRMAQLEKDNGLMINFAETHDNLRLAEKGENYARMRTVLCALLSDNGGFGFANGVEFFAREKIDVHKNSFIPWDNPVNQVDLIGSLQRLMKNSPLFHAGAEVKIVPSPGNTLAIRRSAEGKTLLGLINLDCANASKAEFSRADFDPEAPADLLSNQKLKLEKSGENYALHLPPGGFALIGEENVSYTRSGLIEQRRFRAGALEIWRFFHGDQPLENRETAEELGEKYRRDPAESCREIAGTKFPPVVNYSLPSDNRRLVMLPDNSVLLISSEDAFSLNLHDGEKVIHSSRSIFNGSVHFMTVALPPSEKLRGRELGLSFCLFHHDGVKRTSGRILLLEKGHKNMLETVYSPRQVKEKNLCFLHADTHGGMSQIRAEWGRLYSKYDAMLAANLDPSLPVDRTVVLSRCRMWLNNREYSQEISIENLLEFSVLPPDRAKWRFEVQAGQGKKVRLVIEFAGADGGDKVFLNLVRLEGKGGDGMLDDSEKVNLIVRPDVDNRINHNLTKAYAGAEKAFPGAVSAGENFFNFALGNGNALHLVSSRGRFISAPEWQYMVNLEQEELYGQEHQTDVFSPGYFEIPMLGGQTVTLAADVNAGSIHSAPPAAFSPDLGSVLKRAMKIFAVRRGNLRTVIAGYPWFLDWGRDTLIALRGMIAGGMIRESADIIRTFASFEENGTIPNVIRGNDISNRDTSDAPLWLFAAVSSLIGETGSEAILDEKCGSRSLREVLESIIKHYMSGTPNGIVMDKKSKFIFSPPHFTWMDTNYPAGTPRCGYPIEIQALWYCALEFAGRFIPEYAVTAREVSENIEKYFYHPDTGEFGDCIHLDTNAGAENGVLDDHIRCNAIFALTLGAVKTPEKQFAILRQSECLIVPGGIRSLADRPVKYPLGIDYNGRRLNDEHHPYIGIYRGPEDTSRKLSYHNGCVWLWVFPSYCEAMYDLGGPAEKERSRQLLGSVKYFLESASPGQLPEIADGDYPHRPQGCTAQAWSVTEFYRVWNKIFS